jgi:hypothetical protein
MAPYDLVIWFTGYDGQTSIEPADENELETSLHGGSSLSSPHRMSATRRGR